MLFLFNLKDKNFDFFGWLYLAFGLKKESIPNLMQM